MKNKIYTFKTYMLLVFLFATTLGYSQIAVNSTQITQTCSLSGFPVEVKVPTEVLSGDNIPLNITLSGDYGAACVKTVSITSSSNLDFQGSPGVPFINMGGGTYQNDPSPTQNNNPGPLIGNQGYNFNVYYKFPNHTTCNGEVGTFDVTVTLDCAGVITTCTTSISVIARAANYWTVTKEFVIGDLVCGTSKWRIKILNNNPNPSGYGNYKIQGALTENTSVPVVSNAVININANDWVSYKYVTLQNCQNAGTQITNNIDYNFSLGDGCETMIGTATDISPPLQSPNASWDFTKTVFSSSGIYSQNSGNLQLTAGCSGVYRINIYNDGNVPWQINSITDVIPFDVTITGISDTYWGAGYTGIDPNMWVNSPTINGQTYVFTPATNPYLLNPGDYKSIYLYFNVNSNVTTGSIISNTAQINFNAGSVTNNNGGNSTQCSGINCPQIDQSIQNDTVICNFEVVAPFPKEIFKKCVTNQPPGNIYNIGDLVHFTYIIGNAGSGDLNTNITDYIGLPNQNLQIVPASITPTYYENNYYSTNGNWLCNTTFSNPQPINFSVNWNTSNYQNPTFSIVGMPGICDFYKANYIVIEFDAVIKTQMYGNKVNTAHTPTQQSSASYTVDQIGILEVNKNADQEIVENGANFNYIIDVTNNGSVPLDNIVITDMLPDCVSVNGQISIEDDLATPIPFTTNGSLTININPTTQIFPGIDFTITIPVTKSGGGNCCNESVSVTANMITSGSELSANYGSPEAPAACVTGTECCDIEDFDATIIQETNGSFNVNINGGSVPLQEVEISMVDYHIEYAERDCKPDDLGIFGTLTTSTTNLNNLILNSGDNGTSSLAWLIGNPSIINSSVNLDILYPEVLNLDCCDVDFNFCLKVKVKDVNCNVCEKIVCFSSKDDPEPCEIDIKPIGSDNKYCVGDTINLNWSGTTPTGAVNISLFDVTNSSVYSVLASGIPNTGSFTYTIPSGIPCDPARTWSIIVEDSERLCFDRSDPFIIECCDDECDCGEWLSKSVSIKQYFENIPKDPKQKNYFDSAFEKSIECGSSILLKPTLNYTFTAPNYVCNPENCEVEYKWEVEDPNAVIQSGNGKSFNYSFNTYGTYKITFTPICGGVRCEPCIIYVKIDKFIQHEPDPIGVPHDLPTTGDVYNPKTGKTWMNKNLGASRVATSPTDALAFGDLYQWGRLTDGHEKRTSSTIATLSNSNIPGHGKFITNSYSQIDWRSPKNNMLWQGANGINNPCPSGYRLPTEAELNAERLTWISNNIAGAFASPLKWVAAGARNKNGSIDTSSKGYYWASNTSGNDARSLRIFSANANIYGGAVPNRGAGFSIRCIKN